ncbi:MAG: cation:proton antiporter [Candidatus Kariarchaeaceae archaeon]
MSDVDVVINTIAIIIFGGIVAGRIAERFNFPKMVILILIGVGLSAYESAHLIDFSDDLIQEVALTIAELTLILILYYEGQHMDLRSLGKYLLPILILAVVGTVVTASLVATIITYMAIKFSGVEATGVLFSSLLIAAIIVPTDPAATFSILRNSGGKVKKKFETMLGGESAFNDVIAILLVLVIFLPKVIEEDYTLEYSDEIANEVVQQLFGGIAFGIGVSIVTLILSARFKSDAEFAYISISGAFAIFIFAHELGVSAAIAALFAGIMLKNPRFIFMSKKYDDAAINVFWESVVYLIEIFAFVFIGLLFDKDVVEPYIKIGVALSLIALAARTISVYLSTLPLEIMGWTREILSNKERLFISFAGFKGLTTAVLALLAYVSIMGAETPNEDLANLILYTSLFLILFSGIGQGLILPLIIKKSDIMEHSGQ